MQEVVEADYDVIERHESKLTWYYGSNDHWCPVEYYEDMKASFPLMDIHLCRSKFEHAFVLNSSQDMAHFTWQHAKQLNIWMQEFVFLD